jgi:hypothetical protein
MATPRSQIYAALDSERAYQNSKWRPSDDPSGRIPHTITEWLTYMRYYVEKGIEVQTLSHDEGAGLDFLRKVAALGVAGMEQHGAPQRAGFECDIPH